MTNKESTRLFLMVLCLFLWAMVTIITCSAVWNSHPTTFIGIVAGISFVINGVCIYFAARQIAKSEREAGR